MKRILYALPLLCLIESVQADDVLTLIKRKAIKYKVDPKLVYSIAMVESSLNPDAVGGLGELGLFQLRPEFHDVEPGNVKRNIDIAVQYLSYVKTRCQNRYGDAWFICFNTGPNRAKVIENPKEFDYYIKVMNVYKGVSL